MLDELSTANTRSTRLQRAAGSVGVVVPLLAMARGPSSPSAPLPVGVEAPPAPAGAAAALESESESPQPSHAIADANTMVRKRSRMMPSDCGEARAAPRGVLVRTTWLVQAVT